MESIGELVLWMFQNFGFTHTTVKKFDHLPFTVGFMELEI